MFADVTSANVVGYMNKVTTDGGFKYLTPTFLHVDGTVNDFQDIQMQANLISGAANIQLLDKNGRRTATYHWCKAADCAKQSPVIEVPAGKTGLWTVRTVVEIDEEEVSSYSVIPGSTELLPGMAIQLSLSSDKTISYNGQVSDYDICVTNKIGGFMYVGNPYPQDIALDDFQMDATVNSGAANVQFLDKNGRRLVTYHWCKKSDCAKQTPVIPVPDGYNGVWTIRTVEEIDEEETYFYTRIEPAVTVPASEAVQIFCTTDKSVKIMAPYSL